MSTATIASDVYKHEIKLTIKHVLHRGIRTVVSEVTIRIVALTAWRGINLGTLGRMYRRLSQTATLKASKDHRRS